MILPNRAVSGYKDKKDGKDDKKEKKEKKKEKEKEDEEPEELRLWPQAEDHVLHICVYSIFRDLRAR